MSATPLEHVQEVLDRLDEIADPIARALAQDAVSAVMDLYGSGLERIGDVLRESGTAGEQVREALLADGVIASLLLIHGLYPVDLETRVREALDTVRPYMASHGGAVELLEVTDEGVARIRLEGSCSSCRASSSTLELAIKSALDEHAPDLAALEVVEGAPVLPITLPEAEWHVLGPVGAVEEGALAAVAEMDLVVANVDGSLLAYRDRCEGCGTPLHLGVLRGPELECTGCGLRFNLARAGRTPDADVQLRPVPLLGEGPTARVALAG